MRVETLWQGELRVARTHWWGQVLNRPNAPGCEEVFDEVLLQRFRFLNEESRRGEATGAVEECWG